MNFEKGQTIGIRDGFSTIHKCRMGTITDIGKQRITVMSGEKKYQFNLSGYEWGGSKWHGDWLVSESDAAKHDKWVEEETEHRAALKALEVAFNNVRSYRGAATTEAILEAVKILTPKAEKKEGE